MITPKRHGGGVGGLTAPSITQFATLFSATTVALGIKLNGHRLSMRGSMVAGSFGDSVAEWIEDKIRQHPRACAASPCP